MAELICAPVAPGLSVAQTVVRVGMPPTTPACVQSMARDGSRMPPQSSPVEPAPELDEEPVLALPVEPAPELAPDPVLERVPDVEPPLAPVPPEAGPEPDPDPPPSAPPGRLPDVPQERNAMVAATTTATRTEAGEGTTSLYAHRWPQSPCKRS